MAVKISDLLSIPTKVTVNGTLVEVSPLTLEQIVKLLAVYRYDLVVMFSDTVSGDLNLITLVATAPRMVADILAYGMGADGQQEDILKLPGFTQVELLAEIWKVSVPDPKKLMSLLLGAMEGLHAVGLSPSLQEEEPTPQLTELPTTEAVEPPVMESPSSQPEQPSTTT
jgi:hypothetical protein